MTDADATRLAGKETDATRLSVDNFDATRLAGEAYRTRIVPSTAIDDQTRIAQEGFQSKLARDAAELQSDTSEIYKLGDMIGDRYEVSAIHHGAMGVVYGCFDHQTKLPRALKTVRSRHMQDKQVLSQFESEAAVWISLEKHPYIVRAYLFRHFDNRPYVITEYVCGPEGMEGDLRGWLGHPRLTLPVAVAMALQIAQGMQHAVRKVPNLVHRDLKPANILVNGDGKAMVTDFGLVGTAEDGAGTPAYMSPEQWREDVLDARSDIYAYGCILFEMFTGHRLFSALTEGDWERSHRENIPAALTSLTPELPGEIDQFVHCCLEKEPTARPQNWDEVVTFVAEWYHRLTGKSVVLDFSSLTLDCDELLRASYSLGMLKRWNEMILVCDRALSINSNRADIWCNKGVAFLRLQRYEEAIKACNQAILIDRNIIAAYLCKGIVLYDQKKHEEALEFFDQALAFDQTFEVALYKKASSLQILKRYEEAIYVYEKLLKINQYQLTPWKLKGDLLFTLKRYEEAVEAFDKALEIDINYFDAWHLKGSSLYFLNLYEDAICAYDQALKINPNSFGDWGCKGLALFNLNRYDEAIQSYDNALAIDQNIPLLLHHKSLALTANIRFEDAIQAEDKALAINPNYFDAWIGRGDALYNLIRYEEAILAYDHALIINANDSTALQKRSITVNALNARIAAETLKSERNSGFSWAKFFGK